MSHQRLFGSIPVRKADLEFTLETRDAEQSEIIVENLSPIISPVPLLRPPQSTLWNALATERW